MNRVYIIRNQDQRYLDKHGQWVDGSDGQALYRTQHRDEAINTKVEQSVRNPQLRLALIEADLNDKGQVHLTDPIPTGSAPEQTIDPEGAPLFSRDTGFSTDAAPDHDETLGTTENATPDCDTDAPLHTAASRAAAAPTDV